MYRQYQEQTTSSGVTFHCLSQRTHILLSYSKTLSVGLVWGLFEICQAFPSEDEQHRVAFLMTLDLYPGFK